MTEVPTMATAEEAAQRVYAKKLAANLYMFWFKPDAKSIPLYLKVRIMRDGGCRRVTGPLWPSNIWIENPCLKSVDVQIDEHILRNFRLGL